MNLSAKELSNYLMTVNNSASRVNKLKIAYRPYICPFASLLAICKTSQSIMDIGCGSGQFLLLLSKYTNAIKLGGIEISSTLVETARELLNSQRKANFKIEVFDGIHMPDFICEFETVTLIDVFHHVHKERQIDFITELHRKMGKGSKLIFKDIDASSPYVYLNKLHDTFLGGGAGNEISVSGAEQMLNDTGFKITSISKKRMLWYPHYTIVCSK